LSPTKCHTVADTAKTNLPFADHGPKGYAMKRGYCIAVGLTLLAASAYAQQPAALNTARARASYSLGQKIGHDSPPALNDKQQREALAELERRIKDRHQQSARQTAEKNLWDGRAFLAKNRQQPGVITSMSGLQYKILAAGSGKRPGPRDRVTVHYRGRLLDGTEFDSSYRRNKPTTLAVQGVIRGWTEALLMMKPGARWQLFIPPDLAYGEKNMPGIGPNATLIFDIELLSVN
jgi:FKBP-type peptidyl-prolyl cis-trans isomerase FklB